MDSTTEKLDDINQTENLDDINPTENLDDINPTENLDALNETGSRGQEDRRENSVEVAQDRRKVQRRRLIDPTTCERDYSNDEIEFMKAMDDYKRLSGRMFPTCSEILEVLRAMGYVRVEMQTEEQICSQEEQIDDETSENTGIPAMRTSDVMTSDLDQFDELEESFEDDFAHEFDEE